METEMPNVQKMPSFHLQRYGKKRIFPSVAALKKAEEAKK